MNKKNSIIFTIIILVIMIIIALYYLKYSNDHEYNNIVVDEETEIQLVEVEDVKKIYYLEECIDEYLNGLNNTLNIIDDYDSNDYFYINKAYNIEATSKNIIYFIDGLLIKNDLGNVIDKKNLKLVLTVDNQNTTYNIAKYGSKYTDVINYNDNISGITFHQDKIKEINENIGFESYNYWYFTDSSVTDEQIAKRFYEELKINIVYFSKDIYSKLDDNYKKQRFNSYENFEKYMQKYKIIIEESTLSKFSINKNENYTEYTLVDTHQNSFIIITKDSPMEYRVFLDNYTIKTDGYEKRYSNSTNNQKITTNINIFMSMINTLDYKHAYNLLDGTFKSNNFKTEDLFEKYINNNFFDYNIVNLKGIKEQGSYYVCELEIKNNNSSASEKKELTIIMKLLEGTDFVMSFNIK